MHNRGFVKRKNFHIYIHIFNIIFVYRRIKLKEYLTFWALFKLKICLESLITG